MHFQFDKRIFFRLLSVAKITSSTMNMNVHHLIEKIFKFQSVLYVTKRCHWNTVINHQIESFQLISMEIADQIQRWKTDKKFMPINVHSSVVNSVKPFKWNVKNVRTLSVWNIDLQTIIDVKDFRIREEEWIRQGKFFMKRKNDPLICIYSWQCCCYCTYATKSLNHFDKTRIESCCSNSENWIVESLLISSALFFLSNSLEWRGSWFGAGNQIIIEWDVCLLWQN